MILVRIAGVFFILIGVLLGYYCYRREKSETGKDLPLHMIYRYEMVFALIMLGIIFLTVDKETFVSGR